MTLSRGLRATLLAVTTLALVFVYAPLAAANGRLLAAPTLS